MLREFIWNALIDGLGSYLIYLFVHRHHSEFHAIAWSMLPPALNNGWSLLRKRHLDLFGVIVIGGLLASLGLVLLGGSPRLLLVRDSLITGVIGVVFLVSLLFPRPLLYHAARQVTARIHPDEVAELEARYDASPSHLGLPLMTAVWGVVLVAEALLRTFCALTFSIPLFMAVWPFINLGAVGATSLWSFWYGRRLQDREEALFNEEAPAPEQ